MSAVASMGLYPRKIYAPVFFSKSVVFLLISSIKYFLFLAFLSENRVILLSVDTLTVRGVLLSTFIVSNACSALGIVICSA